VNLVDPNTPVPGAAFVPVLSIVVPSFNSGRFVRRAIDSVTCQDVSQADYELVIVDNLSRRNIDVELGCDSLTPIQSPSVRNRGECVFRILF
jgi:hypothetical protein